MSSSIIFPGWPIQPDRGTRMTVEFESYAGLKSRRFETKIEATDTRK